MATDDRPATALRSTALPSGEVVPVLGQGTWAMAEHPGRRAAEIASLRAGIDLGMTLIDTAEMYADGGAEELVAEALGPRRAELFLGSKVLPSHASRQNTITACERSLRRLKTDRLDLYLLHWRGSTRLEETLEAFSTLLAAKKILHWGVSNFDLSDLDDLERAAAKVGLVAARGPATNQILYNLSRRGIEHDLLPRCQAQKLPVMAYSPIEQGRLLEHSALRKLAERHGATPAQIALAWVLRQPHVLAIPKAGTEAHARENLGALALRLTSDDIVALDKAFPPPTSPRPLEML